MIWDKHSVATISAATAFVLILLMINVHALQVIIGSVFAALVVGALVFAFVYETVELMQGEDE